MTFLGVVVCSKNSEYITNLIENALNDYNIKVFKLNEDNIDNLKNIRFDVILLDECDIKGVKRSVLKELINNSKNIILNSDITENFEFLNNSDLSVITYGFNSKATITVSSVEDDNILICLQRNIKTITDEIIEQQEKNIKLMDTNRRLSVTQSLGILTLEMFYNIDLQ